MARIRVQMTNRKAVGRRLPLYEVLGIPAGGASPRGSTYYKTFQNCPREFFLHYVLGWIPEHPSDALTTGLVWHYCLERYYRAIQAHQLKTRVQPSSPKWLWGGCNAGAGAAYALLDSLAETDGYHEIAAVVRVMFDHYMEHYDRVDRIRILAVEETLQYLGDDPYTCRADLIVEDYERGGMWFWEHKSARAITEDLLSAYDMDLQILGEWWLISHVVDQSAYPPLRGVVVNITTKGSTPKTHRHDVCPSPGHVKGFEHTIGTRKAMLTAAESVGWPKYFGNCAGASRGYSKCSYYDLCQQHPGLTARQLSKANVEDFPGFVAAPEGEDFDGAYGE